LRAAGRAEAGAGRVPTATYALTLPTGTDDDPLPARTPAPTPARVQTPAATPTAVPGVPRTLHGAPSPPPASARDRGPSAGRGPVLLWIAGGAGFALVLVVGLVIAWTLLGGPGQPARPEARGIDPPAPSVRPSPAPPSASPLATASAASSSPSVPSAASPRPATVPSAPPATRPPVPGQTTPPTPSPAPAAPPPPLPAVPPAVQH